MTIEAEYWDQLPMGDAQANTRQHPVVHQSRVPVQVLVLHLLGLLVAVSRLVTFLFVGLSVESDSRT